MPAKTAPSLWIGLFFGILIGVVATLILTARDTSETYEDYRQRRMREAGIRQPPVQQQNPRRTRPPQDRGTEGSRDRSSISAIKAHFMKKFVAALTSKPGNVAPKPGYEPLLKDPSKPLTCAGCHDPNEFDIQGMLARDPGEKAASRYKHAPMFMRPLMEKWVARLNQMHADKLVRPVTCTSCHAFDPRDDETRVRIYPALMYSFVSALGEKPRNKQPASRWKPLLKDGAKSPVRCGTCHSTTGKALEQNLQAGRFNLSRPLPWADNKEFMIDIMEQWVHELNEDARDKLVKTVGCKDCHEVDPRN